MHVSHHWAFANAVPFLKHSSSTIDSVHQNPDEHNLAEKAFLITLPLLHPAEFMSYSSVL